MFEVVTVIFRVFQSLSLARSTQKKKRHIDTLEVKLEVAQGSLRTMKTNLHLDLERLKKSVESLKEDVAKKRITRDGPLLGNFLFLMARRNVTILLIS